MTGRAVIVERLRIGGRLNIPDRTTFFGGGAAGYTDYPVLTPAEQNAALAATAAGYSA